MKAKLGLLSGAMAVVLLGHQPMANSAQLRWQPITSDTPIQMVTETPDITTNFTCDSKSHTCACDGTADCFDLGNSQLCKEGTFKKDDTYPNIYNCEFKF